jgi:hypothetical protein
MVVIAPKIGIYDRHPAEGRDPWSSSRRKSGFMIVIPPKVGIHGRHRAENRDL